MVEEDYKRYLMSPDKPTFDSTIDKIQIVLDAITKAMEE